MQNDAVINVTQKTLELIDNTLSASTPEEVLEEVLVPLNGGIFQGHPPILVIFISGLIVTIFFWAFVCCTYLFLTCFYGCN